MTQDDPKPQAGPTDYIARYLAHEQRTAALHPVNKAAVLDALKSAGITWVTVRFDGYGDSGQIEEVVATSVTAEIAIPDTPVELARPVFDSEDIIRDSHPLPEAINIMAYAMLETSHGGRENNEGAYGDFLFDVAAGKIVLEFNYRIEAIDTHNHEF